MNLTKRSAGYRLADTQDVQESRESEFELAALPESQTTSHIMASGLGTDVEVEYSPDLNSQVHTLPDGSPLLGAAPTPKTRTEIRPIAWVKDKKELHGWRFGVWCSAWTVAAILLLNVAMVIVAVAGLGTENGLATVHEGSCKRADTVSLCLHILINGLSSLLLSASNYTMQALVAPTRSDLDRAHARADWMVIGVLSTRNLLRIKWHRVLLWMLLAMSSIPIHLLYNSAVFKTIDTNAYVVVAANPSWLTDDSVWDSIQSTHIDLYSFDDTTDLLFDDPHGAVISIMDFFREKLHNDQLVKKMNNSECISAYSKTFLSGLDNLVLVPDGYADSAKGNISFLHATAFDLTHESTGNDYRWLCEWSAGGWTATDCNPRSLDSANWQIHGNKIEYCLSRTQPQRCAIQISVWILVTVICMNAVKSISMFIIVYTQRDPTLVTIGDAIASYLDTPDALTAGRCLLDRNQYDLWTWRHSQDFPALGLSPKRYNYRELHWHHAASARRCATSLGLIAAGIVGSGVLIHIASSYVKDQKASPWNLGWATINPMTMIQGSLPNNGASGLVASTLLVNTPHVVASLIYPLYNALITSFLLGKEWSDYATKRATLRVSKTPRGAQRSTYHLQLPFRYSIPLITASATLHWLISQSIFLVRVITYQDGTIAGAALSTIGFSVPPILVSLVFGLLLLLAAIGLGYRKLDGSIPVASSCSAAIAAACHRPDNDVDAALLPVQWGEVLEKRNGDVGHCCFTSRPVGSPLARRLYA